MSSPPPPIPTPRKSNSDTSTNSNTKSPPPKMLLTPRISTLLGTSVSNTPALHTLLLLTPTGKLLSASSTSPTSLLRTQSTIACSLWGLYQDRRIGETVEEALPRQKDGYEGNEEMHDRGICKEPRQDSDTNSILVQLEYGIMSVRLLRCGLLFVAIGAISAPNSVSNATDQHQHMATSSDEEQSTSTVEGEEPMERDEGRQERDEREGGKAPSEDGSLRTDASKASRVGIMSVRRQAEEFGRWLDGRLEGFRLSGMGSGGGGGR